jgi:hypothetical protein
VNVPTIEMPEALLAVTEALEEHEAAVRAAEAAVVAAREGVTVAHRADVARSGSGCSRCCRRSSTPSRSAASTSPRFQPRRSSTQSSPAWHAIGTRSALDRSGSWPCSTLVSRFMTVTTASTRYFNRLRDSPERCRIRQVLVAARGPNVGLMIHITMRKDPARSQRPSK